MTDKVAKTGRKTWRRWLPLVLLAVAMGAVYASGLHRYFDFAQLQSQKDALRQSAAQHPATAGLAFMASYAGAVALSLPVATLLTLLGGFLFGAWWGTLYVVTGATAGATIVFLIARSTFGAALRERAGGLYDRIAANMQENAAGYMLFMRLVPLFPFFIVNIVPALFNVRLRTYVVTTFFGILPGTFVYVNLGRTLADIESLEDLVSGRTAAAFALLGLFALVPVIYKQWKKKNERTPSG